MPPVVLRPAVLLAAAALPASCSRKREPAPRAAPVRVSDADDAARRDSIAAAEAARRDSLAREEELRAERERRLTAARSALAAPIHFAFDRSDLSSEAREALDAKVPLLREHRDLRLRLAGHTDERGSDEYNLALGQRGGAAGKRTWRTASPTTAGSRW